MNKAFMIYVEGLAKLAVVANKQTLFYARMLLRVELHESNQYIVSLTAFDKREILKSIGSKSNDPLKVASQYLNSLKKAGLIKPIGGSAYAICPVSAGLPKYMDRHIRERNGIIYETRIYKDTGEQEQSAYIITDDGERIDFI